MADWKKQFYYRMMLKWKIWSIFEVGLPVLFILIIWMLHKLTQTPYGFERTFASADLLLIGGMLLFGIMAEVYYNQKEEGTIRETPGVDNCFFISFLCGIMLMALFVIVKVLAVNCTYPSSSADQLDPNLRLFALASLAGGGTALVLVIWAAHWLTHKKIEALSAKETPVSTAGGQAQ